MGRSLAWKPWLRNNDNDGDDKNNSASYSIGEGGGAWWRRQWRMRKKRNRQRRRWRTEVSFSSAHCNCQGSRAHAGEFKTRRRLSGFRSSWWAWWGSRDHKIPSAASASAFFIRCRSVSKMKTISVHILRGLYIPEPDLQLPTNCLRKPIWSSERSDRMEKFSTAFPLTLSLYFKSVNHEHWKNNQYQ